MANKVAFINGKGGCGKTTSIFHVAGVLAHKGQKVLVIESSDWLLFYCLDSL